jgi:hypothetical protein
VSPYTTDGDLAIDPRELDDEPELANVLEAAGFALAVRPGRWTMSEVQIDLMVPASLGGSGRRGARLGVHGNDVARKASGLEAARRLLRGPGRARAGCMAPVRRRWSSGRSAPFLGG